MVIIRGSRALRDTLALAPALFESGKTTGLSSLTGWLKRADEPPRLIPLTIYTQADMRLPFMQAWFNGKPDFRAVVPAKTIQFAQEKRCATIGRRKEWGVQALEQPHAGMGIGPVT